MKVQLEPIQELDGSYSEEFLKLYYAPSDERFNMESKMSRFGSGKGGLEYHKKMVDAYQKEPEDYRRQTENFIKKKNIEQPPPEQSITVRRGPKLKSDDDGSPNTVKRRLKERERQAKMKVNIPPPMGAAKGPKSPLSKRIKDLE